MAFEKFARVIDIDGDEVLVYREPTERKDEEVESKNLDWYKLCAKVVIDDTFYEMSMDGLHKSREEKPVEWLDVEHLFSDPANALHLEKLARAFHMEFVKLHKGEHPEFDTHDAEDLVRSSDLVDAEAEEAEAAAQDPIEFRDGSVVQQ